MRAQTEHHYDVEANEIRRWCDERPSKVYVSLVETVTTTTRHKDGSTTIHEAMRVVASWTYAPDDTSTGPIEEQE